MPVIKEIPQAKRPPVPIREIKVRELKEKRPLIKAKEVSVLRPESPPKEMTLRTKEGKPVEREIGKTQRPRTSGERCGQIEEVGKTRVCINQKSRTGRKRKTEKIERDQAVRKRRR